MFIKPFFKHNKTTGERYTVFKLCESYRLNWGIHHRIIISFGRLEELETVEQKKLLAKRVEELIVNGGNSLSTSAVGEQVEQLARHYFAEIRCIGYSYSDNSVLYFPFTRRYENLDPDYCCSKCSGIKWI